MSNFNDRVSSNIIKNDFNEEKERQSESLKALEETINKLAAIEFELNQISNEDTAERIGLTKAIDKLNKIYTRELNKEKGE